MSKIKMTVTLPDGTIGSRTTARPYTHVVIAGQINRDKVIQALEAQKKAYQAHEESEWTLRQIAAYDEKIVEAQAQPEFYGEWCVISWHHNAALAQKAMIKYAEYTNRKELRVMEISA